MESRVTGIGGVFFKARDPKTLIAWYRTHLGIDISDWGGTTFKWDDPTGTTVWSIFPADTTYFGTGGAAFMVNFRVKDLAAVLDALRAEGCDVDPRLEATEYGKFGWVTDPEGNRVELWEPPAEAPPA